MHSAARQLLKERTFDSGDWTLEELVGLKLSQGLTISVILPALNEELTVGGIVSEIREWLVEESTARTGTPLIDELVVLDSGSTDDTSLVAAQAGATVIHRDEVFADIPAVTGKGEAMWRGLGATQGDLVVFVDADLRSFTSSYVIGLLGPLLADPKINFVKAFYERPLIEGDRIISNGGGRVTELVARPLLNLYWPELAGVMQPLAGEYAARRTLLEQLPFHCGYGVDIALLIDSWDLMGIRGIAQVDLGTRVHRNHDTPKLGRMAAEVMQTALKRAGIEPTPSSSSHSSSNDGTAFLAQFENAADSYSVQPHEIEAIERPPLALSAQYRAHRAMHTTT